MVSRADHSRQCVDRGAPAGASPRPEAGASAGPRRAERLIIMKAQFGNRTRLRPLALARLAYVAARQGKCVLRAGACQRAAMVTNFPARRVVSCSTQVMGVRPGVSGTRDLMSKLTDPRAGMNGAALQLR
jgi:hypothetical protein